MSLPKDPAELEARLLSTIEALRRIKAALDEVDHFSDLTGDHQLRGCASVCASYAGSVVAEVTS